MFRFGLITALALAFLAPAAVAQEASRFQEGTHTLTLGGSGSSDKDLKDSSFDLRIDVSTFVSNHVEIGLRQTLGYNDGFNAATFVAADYNFDLGNNFVPFVGANIGLNYGEDVDETISAGPELGVRYFVNATTYLQAIVQYEFDAKESFSDGQFLYGVGIGFRF